VPRGAILPAATAGEADGDDGPEHQKKSRPPHHGAL
jgi:hypothetical protein